MWNPLILLSLAFAYGGTAAHADLARVVARKTPDDHQHHVRSGPGWRKGMSMGEGAKMVPFAGKVGWTFNWRNDLDPAVLPEGIQYFPQLWDVSSDHLDNWNRNARAAIARGDKVLLSFNEPQDDQCGRQACMTPPETAWAFKEYITPLKDVDSGITLVAPSITAEGTPINGVWVGKGIDYLRDFLRLCVDCKIDAIAVNWYGHDVESLETFIRTAYDVGEGRYPVWVTEWSFPDGYEPKDPAVVAKSQEFIRNAVYFLDTSPMVQAYAFFWVHGATERVPDTPGTYRLNPIGKAYVGE